MRRIKTVNVLAFLNELYANTRSPKRVALSVLAKKHGLGNAAYESVVLLNIVTKVNDKGKRSFDVVWTYSTPPTITVAEKVVHKMTELNAISNGRAKERNQKETEPVAKLDFPETVDAPVNKPKLAKISHRQMQNNSSIPGRKMLDYNEIQKLFGSPLSEIEQTQKPVEKNKSFSLLWGAVKINW